VVLGTEFDSGKGTAPGAETFPTGFEKELLELIYNFLCKLIHDIPCNPINTLTLLVSITTLILAVYIPRKIMVDSIYADLLHEYRSPTMGAAVLAVFNFYIHDCKNSINLIEKEYKNRYENEIAKKLEKKEEIDYATTLHFQRRLIAQYYWDMAELRYEYKFPRLSQKKLKRFFTPSETELLSIVLYMGKAAAATVFERAKNVSSPENDEDEAPMNKLIFKLYEESEEWE
jgi:hypothetical protein